MKQKKLTAILLSFCLAFSAGLLTGCQKDTPEEKPDTEGIKHNISQKIDAYLTDLKDSSDSMHSNRDIMKYLKNWATAKNLSNRMDKAGNLILEKKPAKGYESVPATILVCPVDYREYSACTAPLSMAMCIAKNSDKAGFLRIIFTPVEDTSYRALSGLAPKLIPSSARVFTLDPGNKGMVACAAAEGSCYRFTEKGRKVKPALTIAYRLSITGLPVTKPDSSVEEVPNPIVSLEKILTWCNNKKDLFELAEFNGGISPSYYAPSASLTMTIDANNEDAFLEKMESVAEKWEKDYGKEYPDSAFTYEKVPLPSRVYDAETTHRLVSFLYTLLDGEYFRDESGNLLSICNVSQIITKKKKICVGGCAFSLDTSLLSEIDEGERTLANLSSIRYKKTTSLPGWLGNEEADLAVAFKKAYDSSAHKSLRFQNSITPTSTAYVQTINKEAEMLSITVNENILKECTLAVDAYLSVLNQESEAAAQ